MHDLIALSPHAGLSAITSTWYNYWWIESKVHKVAWLIYNIQAACKRMHAYY